jgi:hypothetical protein
MFCCSDLLCCLFMDKELSTKRYKRNNLMIFHRVIYTGVPTGFDPAMRKEESLVERIESAYSIPCCHKHLKGLEPLYTHFICFWICVTPQNIHFSP